MSTPLRILFVMVLVAWLTPACAHAQRTLLATSSHWASKLYTSAATETYSVWVRFQNTNQSGTFLLTTRGAVADNHYRQIACGAGIYYISERAGGGTAYNSTTNPTPILNTWVHVAATLVGNTNRTIWVNGNAAASETSTVTPTLLDEVWFGRIQTSSGSYYTSGDIAEPAVWHVQLTAGEIGQLAAGGAFARRAHPTKIRPDKLVWLPDLTIPGAAVPGVNGVTGISNSPALLTAIPPAFR